MANSQSVPGRDGPAVGACDGPTPMWSTSFPVVIHRQSKQPLKVNIDQDAAIGNWLSTAPSRNSDSTIGKMGKLLQEAE